MSYENHRHPAQRETGQRGGRKTQGSPGTPPFRPLAQPLAGLHCRVPGVVAYPSGVALLAACDAKMQPLTAKTFHLVNDQFALVDSLLQAGFKAQAYDFAKQQPDFADAMDV